MKYQTKIYGHRGASEYAPENTIPAFQLAYDMGADGIEFDVQMSRDGHLVITHDEEISRVSDGKGFVKDFTLEELRQFNFNKLHPEYGEVKIPVLEEVLNLFKDKDFLLNIELKNGIIPYDGLEEEVLRLVVEYGCMENIIFSSFYHESMRKLRNTQPNAKVAFLYCDGILEIPEYMERYGVDIVHPAWYHLNRGDLLDRLHNKGIQVNTWTVNSGKDIRSLCDMGVDGIITNRPDLGSEIRDDKR